MSKGIWNSLTRRKPIAKSLEQTSGEKHLTWYDLTAYGIAATVGSGIYVTCGRIAKDMAGPSVVFSTGIAGLLSLFTGICYLEFASSLPIAGSGYAYFYTLMGEFLGWLIGWNLTLEYAFAAAAIAGGWSQYLVSVFAQAGWKVPEVLYHVPLTTMGGIDFRINVMAAVVILLIGGIVSRGLKFGAIITNCITALNLGIILFILGVGSMYVEKSNWTPFMPHGLNGVFSGSGEMFFSYIGYDTISSLAGEAINPGRDLPIAVLLTVGTATVLYMGVGLVLTGMKSYLLLDERSPLAHAFVQVGAPWASYVVAICALFTMAATMFACLMGQPKIFQAIAKDGLLPRLFARENHHGTPVAGVSMTAILTAAMALFLDVDNGLIDMISFGTLLGMSILCSGLLVVRFEQHRPISKLGTALSVIYLLGTIVSTVVYNTDHFFGYITAAVTMLVPFLGLCYLFAAYSGYLASTSLAFSTPLMPLFPCVAMAANSFMMLQMEKVLIGFFQFSAWTAIGLLIYFTYGINNSQLIHDEEK
ncbi:Amino acid permease [Paramicrosporidium saccamoebae]|uniref:Amino acid permease n=1 Tax=Paramicrosporidium saccamoebae TaxID=1246581 RepID=A0A2H9THY9_9FUNG|nr:Amino acid permease [Paramicrosporidium saccamoebae]